MADQALITQNSAKRVIGTPFQPGNPGKQPGTTAKLTRTVKEAVLAVFNELENEEGRGLKSFAVKHPRDFYNMAAKLIPTDITADIKAMLLVEPITGMVIKKQDAA